MKYKELDDYAYFGSDAATIEQLFFTENMLGVLEQIKDDDKRERAKTAIVATLQTFLKELQEDEKNQPEGELLILVKSHHIQLRKVLLKIVQNALPIAAKAALSGGTGVVEVGIAVGKAAVSTKRLIQKLDDSELDTCEAVLRVIARKQSKTLVIHKANGTEIKKIFEGDPELTAPGDLDATLKDLTQRKVLECEVVGNMSYYQIVF